MSPAMLEALRHPLRRQILRELHGSDGPVSPVELAGIFVDWETSAIAFHFRALEKMRIVRCKETKRIRGSTKHLFVSNVKRNSLVLAILGETEKADGPLFVRAG
jgi:predicted transcriptional regulator